MEGKSDHLCQTFKMDGTVKKMNCNTKLRVVCGGENYICCLMWFPSKILISSQKMIYFQR